MKKQVVSIILLCAAALFPAPDQAAITAPAGALPAGMPSRIVVGLFEGWGGTWVGQQLGMGCPRRLDGHRPSATSDC
jgi:hypothetical protein